MSSATFWGSTMSSWKFPRWTLRAASMAALAVLTGCAMVTPTIQCTTSINELSYSVAQQLKSGLSREDADKSIVVTSMVNLDDMAEVSPIGRLVSELVGTRLAQLGVQVVEPRLKGGISIAKGGEQVLSRDAKDLATKLNAHAYVTGTVSKMQGKYFFNARLVRVKDSKILAAYDVCLTGKVKEAGL